jgi:histidinol-phosphate aminotransferase
LQIFCADGDKIIFPDPTFSMYSIIAQGRGLVPVPFPLNDHWDFRATDLLDAARAQRPRIAFLSYPNNPTGNCFSQAEVLRMVREFPGIVVVDEAYYDFTGGKTFLNHLADNNNLIILRSLSKIGLAALRVGYAVAHPSIIEQINKVRLPYNSNTVSQVLAEKTLEHFAAVEQQIEQTLAERRRMAEALSAHPELTVFPADANFILLRVRDAQTLFQQMAENGVLVRHLGSHPRLLNCLRVTIGARAENDRFLLQMETLLRAKSLHE